MKFQALTRRPVFKLMAVLRSCLAIVIFIYGVFFVFGETFVKSLPYGLLTAVAMYVAILFLRVPPPQLYAVETIAGEDLRLDVDVMEDSNFLMKTIAHRGAGFDAPENSLEAFKLCSEKGCMVIEFDVSLTADCVPIIFHDRTLERLTGLDKRISRNIWEDLSSYDISMKHPLKEKFRSTSIPTLDQTVEQLLSCKQRMFIDLKNYNRKMVTLILELFEKYPELYTNAVVSSFFPNLIYLIRKRNPRIVCSLAWRPGIFAYTSYSGKTGMGTRREKSLIKHLCLRALDVVHKWLLSRITYYIMGISFILLHKDVISADTVLKWSKNNVRVIAWTVNAPAEKQYFSKVLKITYMTDTLVGEATVHGSKSFD